MTDALVIGSGPGGSAVALALLERGLHVTMVERGEPLERSESNRDSKKNFQDKAYRTTERWTDQDGAEFQPWMHYYLGGNAKLYGAALYRFRPADFGELEYTDGLSPAWPITYDDLAPHYDRAEELYHVHGDRDADPTEPTKKPFPHAPLEDEPFLADLRKTLGIQNHPLPLGVDLTPEDDAGFEVRLDRFDPYPDPSFAKSDPESRIFAKLQSYGDQFVLHTGWYAETLIVEPGNHISGARNTAGEELRAGTTYCAAGAINSAALFLRTEDRHPEFAAPSGLVGTNYMAHLCSTASAIFETPHEVSF
ncbi:hypothetical protein OAF27_01285, partial [Verrucomicrobiales bacterium]|nr:hypothetical protein [Verrucomicrobiales bacterium]